MARGDDGVKRSIPITIAIPTLLLAVAIAAFGMELRADVAKATEDQVHGHDLDLFIERLQRAVDDHTKDSHSAPINVPSWRRESR